MTDTPIFDRLAEAAGATMPLLEPFPSHEDFLLDHGFTAWLGDLDMKVRAEIPYPGGLGQAAATKKRRKRKQTDPTIEN